eukprot:581384-Amphidinium_carterae.2
MEYKALHACCMLSPRKCVSCMHMTSGAHPSCTKCSTCMRSGPHDVPFTVMTHEVPMLTR